MRDSTTDLPTGCRQVAFKDYLHTDNSFTLDAMQGQPNLSDHKCWWWRIGTNGKKMFWLN